MQPTAQLAEILPALVATVEQIRADQLDDPTPCDDFTVHDVLDHMMVGGCTFAYQFRGEEPPAITPPPVYGWVPVREFTAAMDGLLEAVGSPGALDRTIAAPVGDLPGDTFARFLAFDGLIHGWDLSRATGAHFGVADVIVDEVAVFTHGALTDDLRDGDTFAAATTPPADATPIDRLAAFSGRSV